jgi:hypothetical protein
VIFCCTGCDKTYTSKRRLEEHMKNCTQKEIKNESDVLKDKLKQIEQENLFLNKQISELKQKNEDFENKIFHIIQVNMKKLEFYEHQQKRKNIPSKVRDDVWKKQCDPTSKIGKCYVCKEDITDKNFECGHITSVKAGGSDSIQNLMPVCRLCNMSMGTMNMETYKEIYYS